MSVCVGKEKGGEKERETDAGWEGTGGRKKDRKKNDPIVQKPSDNPRK